MNILFVQHYLFPYAGVMAVSGAAKEEGHCTSVIVGSMTKEKDILSYVKMTRPDVFAFSIMSVDHKWLMKTAQWLKDNFPDIPIIVGGVHAMLYPDDIMASRNIDYVCYGEGEHTIKQYLKFMQNKIPITDVLGVYYRENGHVKHTRLNALVDMDATIFDRAVYYDKYSSLKNLSLKYFLALVDAPIIVHSALINVFKKHSKDKDIMLEGVQWTVLLGNLKLLRKHMGWSRFILQTIFLYGTKTGLKNLLRSIWKKSVFHLCVPAVLI